MHVSKVGNLHAASYKLDLSDNHHNKTGVCVYSRNTKALHILVLSVPLRLAHQAYSKDFPERYGQGQIVGVVILIMPIHAFSRAPESE